MNGELSPQSPEGFRKIAIHLKEDQHIEVEGGAIVVRDKQSTTPHIGDEVFTVGRCCVLIFPCWTRLETHARFYSEEKHRRRH